MIAELSTQTTLQAHTEIPCLIRQGSFRLEYWLCHLLTVVLNFFFTICTFETDLTG